MKVNHILDKQTRHLYFLDLVHLIILSQKQKKKSSEIISPFAFAHRIDTRTREFRFKWFNQLEQAS